MLTLLAAAAALNLTQPTPADDPDPAGFARAAQLAKDIPKQFSSQAPIVKPFWSSDGKPFWFGASFEPDASAVRAVDLATGEISSAIDVPSLASALGKALGKTPDAGALQVTGIRPSADGFEFQYKGSQWTCRPGSGTYSVVKSVPRGSELLPADGPPSESPPGGDEVTVSFRNTSAQTLHLVWISPDGGKKTYATIPRGGSHVQQTFSGHLWLITDTKGHSLGKIVAAGGVSEVTIGSAAKSAQSSQADPRNSPDGRWAARVRGGEVFLLNTANKKETRITNDAKADDSYDESTIAWAPDSSRFAIQRIVRAPVRKITLVESSPKDQVQPKVHSIPYPKPGDPIDRPRYRIIEVDPLRVLPADDSSYPNPWSLSDGSWSADSRRFTFVYNQRGHQLMRIIAIEPPDPSPRILLEETSKTFIDYADKFWIRHLPASGEILWASERSGWNHIYLLDAATGAVKNSVTSGEWNVREVVNVDEKKRQLTLKVMGLNPGEDPYHVHWARVSFDGSGFTRLTGGDGTHTVSESPDGSLLLDTWSRVDQPPVTELRRASDGSKIAELARADDAVLRKAGWSPPERFAAKGRDGKTDIYGIIVRPTGFDPEKRYPVIEHIYAGPQDAFVPKSFSAWSPLRTIAELGFVVVQIDGMGTNWRNKAFHDVAWKNLSDSGLPDRIAWIKAAASTRPWMDISRVGIYGGSAGGQSALAALLHHGDFYRAGAADCGCHDNRMDKIWWNEAWMGWPVDKSYEENSNVTHASKLQGNLLLTVGELDRNVDPASTLQVANALQRAGKTFELIILTGEGHSAGETAYAKRRRAEFFIRHLLGPEQ